MIRKTTLLNWAKKGIMLSAAFGMAYAGAMVTLGHNSALAAPQLILGSGNVDSDKPRRPFMLETSMGDTFGDQDLLGKFTLIYFGYTFCPDVCPTSLMTLTEVLGELGDDARAMTPIFISVDPDRDSLPILHDYTTAFHPQIIGMTGPKVMVDAVVDAYNARYKFIPSDDGDPMGYSVDHTASMAFVGPNGRIVKRFGYGKPVEEIVFEIKAELSQHQKLVRTLKANASK
ncbi:MAG: SCO family protein [Cohaesibacter sp.]|jgi:protein SCO1/2|nr:SCO family protein [Cohaesibacter sp.]